MESIQILLLALVLISVSFAGANYLGWRLFDRPRHALIWAVAYGLAAIQYSFNLFRDALVSPEIYWLLANSTSFAVVLCAFWGHRERLKLETSRAAMVTAWVALTLASVISTVIFPDPGLRTALAPGFCFVCMSAIAILLIKNGPKPRLAQNVAAVVHLLFGLTQGTAALIALRLGEGPSPELLLAYRWANFTFMPSFYVAMGVSAILLLATDLSYKLRLLALTDPLTHVLNRRGFINNSLGALARTTRGGKPLSLILCDLDHLKRINDRYGHTVGDRALQHFTRILLDSVRTGDIVGRIGGEEFAVCLEAQDCGGAEAIAERVRRTLAGSPLVFAGQEVPLTASYGISTWSDGDDISAMLQHADIALYNAKRAGRDAIHINRQPLLTAPG